MGVRHFQTSPEEISGTISIPAHKHNHAPCTSSMSLPLSFQLCKLLWKHLNRAWENLNKAQEKVLLGKVWKDVTLWGFLAFWLWCCSQILWKVKSTWRSGTKKGQNWEKILPAALPQGPDRAEQFRIPIWLWSLAWECLQGFFILKLEQFCYPEI